MEALVSIVLGVLLAWFTTRLIIWFSALIGIGVIAVQKTEAAAMSLLDGIVDDGAFLSSEPAKLTSLLS